MPLGLKSLKLHRIADFNMLNLFLVSGLNKINSQIV